MTCMHKFRGRLRRPWPTLLGGLLTLVPGTWIAPAVAGIPDVVAPSLPIDLAVETAKKAVAACTGFHVGVAILDASGQPKLYYIPDGTAGVHALRGFRKANTALLIGAPSEEIETRAATDKALAAKVAAHEESYITWAGGVPIVSHGRILGAIGVSGAEPSTKDKECALTALRAVQDRLSTETAADSPAHVASSHE